MEVGDLLLIYGTLDQFFQNRKGEYESESKFYIGFSSIQIRNFILFFVGFSSISHYLPFEIALNYHPLYMLEGLYLQTLT